MFASFPVFNTHLDLAHFYWEKVLQSGDTVIDATCGNGKDTLRMARSCQGTVYAIDLQPNAIECTKQLLHAHGFAQNIHYIQGCHSRFPETIAPGSVKLIVYNLGYLPGGNKNLTTTTKTTLESLNNALPLLKEGALLSITCYPGHAEGEIEADHVLKWASSLDPCQWSCCLHRWLNRRKAPCLCLIQKFKT